MSPRCSSGLVATGASLIGLLGAARMDLPTEEHSKSCVIEGPPDSGISVSFPVSECLKECNHAVPWKEAGDGVMQITKQFSLLFTTQVEDDQCVCSDKGGVKLVKYKLSKKMEEECSNDSIKAKMECWSIYKMTRAANLDFSGGSPVVKIDYQKSKDDVFTFNTNNNKCFECEGESCSKFSLPSPLASMSELEREAIAGLDPKMKTGGLKTFLDAVVMEAASGLVSVPASSEDAESEEEPSAEDVSDSAPSSEEEPAAEGKAEETTELAPYEEPGEPEETTELAPYEEVGEAERGGDVEALADVAKDETGDAESVEEEEQMALEERVDNEAADDEGEEAEGKLGEIQDEQEEQKDEQESDGALALQDQEGSEEEAAGPDVEPEEEEEAVAEAESKAEDAKPLQLGDGSAADPATEGAKPLPLADGSAA